jgi:hypothetical protein
MFKKRLLMLLTVALLVSGTTLVHADEGEKEAIAPAVQTPEELNDAVNVNQEIPERVTSQHWAYKEVASLGEKYGVQRKLPEGRDFPKSELLDCFMATLATIKDAYDKDGSQAVSRDDLDTIRTLIVALQMDLFKIDGYRQIRRTIEQLLVQVEPAGVPYYKYMVGVNGFVRGEGQSNFNLSEASYRPGDGSGRALYRVKPFAYLHPANWLDIHIEGQGYGYTGENSDNDISLYQGFVEAKLPREDVAGKNWLALKAGRQEFNYGSAFMLGSDSFFNGLTFDAARLSVQPALPWLNYLTVDLFGGRYAYPSRDGVKGNLSGAYLTYEPAEGNTLEAYLLRDTGSEERHSGERLNTMGFRSTSSVGMFGLEYEAAYQTGRLLNGATGVNDKISAFGGHVDLTGEFKTGNYDNSLFLSFALGSGSQEAADGERFNREFRNSNNDSSLVGDMGVVGDLSGLDVGDSHASGMQVYTIGWGIDIPVGTATQSMLNFSATGRKFVAGKVQEGFSRNVGVETDFTLTYAMNKDYALVVGYDRFFTGKFFRDATGSDKDIDYGYAMLVFNYDWAKRIPLKR